MGDISKNFNRSEFACKCGCGMDTVDTGLLFMLQDIRDKFGPIMINSANRCETHNKSVGGSDASQHKKSRAADIVPLVASLEEVARYIDQSYSNCGLGVYNSFIHVDSRNHKARWEG